MKAALVLVALAAPAAADSWSRIGDRIQGGGYLKYELSALHAVDDDPARMVTPRTSTDLILGGVRLGGFVGEGAHVGYHIALDLLAGSLIARHDGPDERRFAYDVALYPIGIAARFGATGVLAVGAGIGANGAVGALDDAAIVPVQTTLELGRGLRVLGRARFSYVLGAPDRQSGAASVPFADELDAMLGLRLGRAYNAFGFPSGNGYYVALGYREQLGTRFLGITLGYSLEGAMPRRFLDDDRRQREERRRRRKPR